MRCQPFAIDAAARQGRLAFAGVGVAPVSCRTPTFNRTVRVSTAAARPGPRNTAQA